MFFSNEVQIQSNQTHWLCGSYVRLSKEDIDAIKGGKDESNSVTNQKAMIRSYLEEHPELELYEEYVDDGYTGVNFDRPDFKRLMEDVKDRRINCIIVKDLSRFGRNYIEAGKYLEQVFPFLGVRFIAITDDIDTGRQQSDSNSLSCPLRTCLTTPIAVIFLPKYAPILRSNARTGSSLEASPAMDISRIRRTITSW